MGSLTRPLAQRITDPSGPALAWARPSTVGASVSSYVDAAGVTWQWALWTASQAGGLIVPAAGVLEALLIGGGLGIGARVNEGILRFPAGAFDVTIGIPAISTAGATMLGPYFVANSDSPYANTGTNGAGVRPGYPGYQPYPSSITGTLQTYAAPNLAGRSTSGLGDYGYNGAVIARWPI